MTAIPDNRSDSPVVTIIMPIRNEEQFLPRCLESVAQTTYSRNRLEVLVVDGLSTDRSVAIAESFADRLPGLRVLTNPARIQSAAFNLALAQARGDVIVRMDAHTLYQPDYVEQCVRLLESTGAANVGGPQRAAGESPVTRAIAFAVSSRFGAGDATYRYAERDSWVDTVYLGAWRRATVERLGGMNPAWAVNEDYEMNYRLRQAGGKVLVSPAIQSTYFVRGSLPKLARQYFRYGFWKVRTLTVHPRSLRWRQLVAPAFVGYLAAIPILWALVGRAALVPLAAYALVVIGIGLRAVRRLGGAALLVPIIFPIIHCSWGAGFLTGWFRWLPGRRSPADQGTPKPA
jgi:glycosyltransferase involved in cell wall biosynthesis